MPGITYLNLGCGTDTRKDYFNIDIQPFPGVDLISDVCDLDIIESDSIEYIVAQHVLEFLPRRKTLDALKEWRRILKPFHNLEIRVPDIGRITQNLYLNSVSKEMGLHDEMVLSLLYGKQLNEFDVVRNGFTSEFLQGVLTGIGFKIIGVVFEDFDVIISAQKV